MRDVTIKLDGILGLASCATDYGFDLSVLMSAFGEMTGPVTDEEIHEYADSIRQKPDYTDEDYDCISERLTEWRDEYARGEPTQ
jgi:hypothetical protein